MDTIKEKFHHLIDRIDTTDLEDFYELISDYYSEKKKSIDILDELDKIQKLRLDQSLKSAESGKLINHEDALKRLRNDD